MPKNKIIYFFLSFSLLLSNIAFAATLSNKTLYYGLIKNPDVKTVQQILITKGYLVGTPTGNFLSVTKKAIQNFQKANGIPTTGTVGPLTRTALLAPKSVPSPTAPVATTDTPTTPAVTTPTVTDPNDHTPPLISNGTPAFTTLPSGTTSTNISVTTDEPATCKYSTFYNPYNSMESTFDTTPSTTHTASVSNLKDGRAYDYYVQCRDTSNNTTSSNYTIAFSIGGTYTPDGPVAVVPPVNAPTTPPVVPPVTPPVGTPPPYVPPYVPPAGTPVCEATGGAKCYYVAPNGDDTAAGTITAAFKTFYPAIKAAKPGDFIYARGGTYTSANNMRYAYMDGVDRYAMVAISDYFNHVIPQYTTSNGTPGHPITLKAYPGETPIFTGSTTTQTDGTSDILIMPTWAAKSYWVIDGFEIVNGAIYVGNLPGNRGPGYETHDITIQNNYLHNYVIDTAGNNPGMVKINRADFNGAYNIFIRHNHFKNASLTGNPGHWQGLGHMLGGITVLSILGYAENNGSTGYLEITNNEFEQIPDAMFFKNPMLGPVEIHGNIFHDLDMIAFAAASNMHFNHNLAYNMSGSAFYYVGPDEGVGPISNAGSGQNAVVQYNTFVGVTTLMSVAQGVGHNINNNIIFGLTTRMSTASWDTGSGYITKISSSPDPSTPENPATSILQNIHSDNNCFIAANSDFIFVSRYWNTGPPLEFNNFTNGKALYHYDPNSKLIIQSDPTKIFVSPSSNNYTLIDPSQCPSMGVSMSDVAGAGTPP